MSNAAQNNSRNIYGRKCGLLPGLAVVLALLVAGCDKRPLADRTSAPIDEGVREAEVVSTAWPLYLIAAELAGPELSVEYVGRASIAGKVTRETFFPDEAALLLLDRAALVIDNGPAAPSAPWIQMVSVPASRLCVATRSFRLDDFIPVSGWKVTHSHGLEGEHSHPYFVPLPWLAPELVQKLVDSISEGLCGLRPEQAAVFRQRSAELKNRVEQISAEWKKAGASLQANDRFLLATPDLAFVSRGLGLQAEHRFWHGPANVDVWRQRFAEFATQHPDIERLVLLHLDAVPAEAEEGAGELNGKLKVVNVAIDSLEQPHGENEETIGDRLEAVVQLIFRGLEEPRRQF